MDRLVDFLHGDIVRVSSDSLKNMSKIARSNKEKKRYRICLHDDPGNAQHEMIICTTKGDYCRPHKHIDMSESHFILQGKEQIILFTDDGDIRDIFILDQESGDIGYRINAAIFHMSIPITDTVIELETKRGPFVSESNIWAEWAPKGDNCEENNSFIEKIIEKCKSRR